MDRKHLSTLMLILTMIFGTTVGILAVTGSGALTIVAMIGGALLAIGWATLGVYTKDRS